MTLILTLVHTGGLDPAAERKAADFLQAQGAGVLEVRRFDHAADLVFEGPCAGLEEAARAWGVDFAVQPAKFREKKLLVSDMEMTLVRNEFLDDIAKLAGVGEEVRRITSLAMNGEIDFAGSLRARLALLKDQPVTLLEKAWEGMTLMPGAEVLFARLREAGVRTVIVSGGFTFFASRIQKILGADTAVANDLEIENGCLTGRPKEPILGKEMKQHLLESEAATLGLDIRETMAVGDGANDLPMLLRAGLGAAYHAKPSVAAAAKCRIEHSDLTALLAFAGVYCARG